MNIVVELQRRQWSPVDQWDTQLLKRFCEDSCIQSMTKQTIKTTMQRFVTGRQSTLAVAFSCNGEYVASAHGTHEIVIGRMKPYVCFLRTLSGHARTPWVLTFDPFRPHILYSGCLAGKVIKWNILDGQVCYRHIFDPGLSSPVNSITFVPYDSTLIMVAIGDCLFLISESPRDGYLSVIWKTKTKDPSDKLRLVLHHPEKCEILTAVRTNIPTHGHIIVHKTTYRLQLLPFYKCYPPDLTDSSVGVLCPNARVYSPNSCVLTNEFVICLSLSSIYESVVILSMYSILPESFGDCLCSFNPSVNVVSMALSPYEGYLLLGIGPKKSIFHMNRVVPTEEHGAIICKLNKQLFTRTSRQLIHDMRAVFSITTAPSNIALWTPLSAGRGYGVCLGNQKGEVLLWRSSELDNSDESGHTCNIVNLIDGFVP